MIGMIYLSLAVVFAAGAADLPAKQPNVVSAPAYKTPESAALALIKALQTKNYRAMEQLWWPFFKEKDLQVLTVEQKIIVLEWKSAWVKWVCLDPTYQGICKVIKTEPDEKEKNIAYVSCSITNRSGQKYTCELLMNKEENGWIVRLFCIDSFVENLPPAPKLKIQ